jgi:hypothetical protein
MLNVILPGKGTGKRCWTVYRVLTTSNLIRAALLTPRACGAASLMARCATSDVRHPISGIIPHRFHPSACFSKAPWHNDCWSRERTRCVSSHHHMTSISTWQIHFRTWIRQICISGLLYCKYLCVVSGGFYVKASDSHWTMRDRSTLKHLWIIQRVIEIIIESIEHYHNETVRRDYPLRKGRSTASLPETSLPKLLYPWRRSIRWNLADFVTP